MVRLYLVCTEGWVTNLTVRGGKRACGIQRAGMTLPAEFASLLWAVI
jgi:hypothetical protein